MSRFTLNEVFAIPLTHFRREDLKGSKTFWVGREKVKQRMLAALKSACKTGGSFLVGGYRGVGKSKLTELVIDELQEHLKKKKTKLEVIRVDLGVNNEIKTEDILCEIAEKVHTIIEEKSKRFILIRKLAFYSIFFFTLVWLLSILQTSGLDQFKTQLSAELKQLSNYLYLLFFIVLNVFYRIRTDYRRIFKLYHTSFDLVDRIRFTRAFERGSNLGIGVASIKNVLKYHLKNTKTERRLSSREILQELKTVLKILHEISFQDFLFGYKIKVMVLFDEIDKMTSEDQDESQGEVKNRKDLVDSLLGGLKPLLNQSNSIFLFISGREIVDAFHSEAGYTSVLYEGVFDEIFYVPSLLSDHTDGQDHTIHSMVSSYVDILLKHAYWDSNSKKAKKRGVLDEDSIEFIFSSAWEDELKNIANLFRSGSRSVEIKQRLNFADKKIIWSYRVSKFIQDLEVIHEDDSMDKSVEALIEKYKIQHDADFKLIRSMLIRYLTLHSRGNFKRLVMMISEYIMDEGESGRIESISNASKGVTIFGGKLESKKPYLIFKHVDLSRIFLSSKLYSYFDIGLARQLALTDDKILVSSLVAMLDITRFHAQGFTRAMLERTIAGIDVHSESNLMHITDDFINATFNSNIRRTNGNLFTYRFYQSSEIEFNILSKVLGPRASSFEYALDSAEPIRRYYKNEIKNQALADEANSRISIANLNVILGDIYLSERSYDSCFEHYSDAINLFKQVLRDKTDNWRSSGGVSLASHYVLLETILKKGLLEELRENYHQAIRLYTEAKTLANYSFERFENSGKDQPRNIYEEPNFISENESKFKLTNKNKKFVELRDEKYYLSLALNATMAQEYATLKQFGVTKGMLLGNLEEYEPGKTNCDFYTKISLIHYYAGQYEEIVRKTKPLFFPFFEFLQTHQTRRREGISDIKKWQELNDKHTNNPYYVSFVYGNAMFSMLLNNIRKYQEVLKPDDNLDKFVLPWLELIIEMSSYKYEDVISGKYIDDMDNIPPYENLEVNHESCFNHKDFILALFLIGSAANSAKNTGRLALAGEMYLSLILNWIALLEIVPLKLLKKLNILKGEELNYLKNKVRVYEGGMCRPDWLDKIIMAAQKVVAMSNSGAFRRERLTLFGDSEKNVEHSILERELTDIDTLDIISGMHSGASYNLAEKLGPDIDQQMRKRHELLLGSIGIWYRANSGNYLIIFGVWEQYRRAAISYYLGFIDLPKFEHSFKLELLALPFGTMPRVRAIYLWLRARKLSLTILNKQKFDPDDKETQSKLVELFECFVASINLCKLTSKSDDPDTFPPKSTIYLNMYDAVAFIFGDDDERNPKLKQELRKRLSKSAEGFHKCLLNPHFLVVQVEKHLNECRNTVKVASNAYRKETRHKYYLFDDFDDPMYIAEWAFLNGVAAGANLHLDYLRRREFNMAWVNSYY